MSDELSEAIDNATEEAVAEVEGRTVETVEPVKEETTEETPAEETAGEEATEEEKPAAESEEKAPAEEATDEEEPLGLSAEQLKAINDDPKLQAVYKSMQRGLTAKTQSLAEQRKEAEESIRMIEYIRANPDASLEEMAKARGYVLAKKSGEEAATTEAKETANDAVDALMEKYSKELGPESTKILLPFMKEVAQTIVNQAVAPIAEQTGTLNQSAKERGIAAAVSEFGASIKEAGEDWNEEIQAEMAKMMDTVVPGEQTTLPVYLKTLYDATTANRARSAAVRAQVQRLKKAQEEAEPTRSARPAPKTTESITLDMSERDAIAMATRLAEAEANAG